MAKKRSGVIHPIAWEVDEKGCWNCTSHQANGKRRYPAVARNGKRHRMNRFIYELCFGAISSGLVVRHKCDNTKCINPEHLEIGTQADNIRDIAARGRRKDTAGEKNPKAKLTEKDVIAIRKDKKSTNLTLAKRYGVAEAHISQVRHYKCWKNVG